MIRRAVKSLSSPASLFFLSLSSVAVAADSTTNPKDDPNNPLHYTPTNSLTLMAVVILAAIALIQTFFVKKFGGKYMLAMVTATYTYAIGFALRWPLRSNPDSITLYTIYNFFVTLSPCGFIAAEYVLLGRLARWLNADCHLLIPPRKIMLVFVLSDVSTFLTQAAGGGISASASGGSNASRADLGAKIFLVGLILQLVSFVFFTLVFARFIHRVCNYEPSIWNRDRHEKWYNNWRTLALIMFISQIGVIVRSVYRCIELSEGYAGPFTRTEIYLFVLDLAPLLVAIGVYIPFWPGRFIPNGLPERRPDFEEVPFGSSDAIGVDGSPVFMRTKA